jgi:hypothetical protein
MSNENTGPNPYGNRDHVDSGGFQRDDVLAVAGLLGQVSGSLSDIDSKNVGSASENVRAKKLNAKEALNKIIGAATLPPTAVEQPVTHQPHPSTRANITTSSASRTDSNIGPSRC